MTERTALKCLDCANAFVVKTPESQAALTELVSILKTCGECRGKNIVQVAYLASN